MGKAETCRCKRYDDSCKLQSFEGADKCTGYGGLFTWSPRAEPFIKLHGLTNQICRCRWHEKCCHEHRVQYDAGKCIGCRGWLAFSDRVDILLILPDLTDLVRETHEHEGDFQSTKVDLDLPDLPTYLAKPASLKTIFYRPWWISIIAKPDTALKTRSDVPKVSMLLPLNSGHTALATRKPSRYTMPSILQTLS